MSLIKPGLLLKEFHRLSIKEVQIEEEIMAKDLHLALPSLLPTMVKGLHLAPPRLLHLLLLVREEAHREELN